ncbi:LysR family transcriptional regulator [Sphingomonas oryzagri]
MAELDLNLLRTFDALMEHRSVTRAADRLGVSQSAVSHALARLRNVLDDILFIRTQNGLQPTVRAEEMADSVRRGLFHFQNALAPTTFDPAAVERLFTVAAGSYFCSLLIPALVERLRREAPGVSLRLVPPSEMLVTLLDRGEIDLALGASLEVPARFVVEPLYQEKMVWIAAPANPLVHAGRRQDGIEDAARISVVPSRPFDIAGKGGGDVAFPIDHHRRGRPAAGDSRMTVYDSHTAVALVSRTDLIAPVPQKVAAPAVADGRVRTIDWMNEDAPYQMALIWAERRRSDRGLVWLRESIRRTIDDEKSG